MPYETMTTTVEATSCGRSDPHRRSHRRAELMLKIIDYGMVVLVWLAHAITMLALCLTGANLAVDPAVYRHALHCEVVRDVLVVWK